MKRGKYMSYNDELHPSEDHDYFEEEFEEFVAADPNTWGDDEEENVSRFLMI